MSPRSLALQILSSLAFLALFIVGLSPLPAQATTHTCDQGGTCAIGDIGPGGGMVYAVFDAPFVCGPRHASRCQAMEVAPNTWSGTSVDPNLPFAAAPFDSQLVDATATDFGQNYPDYYFDDYGYGEIDTAKIVEQHGACANISTCGYAAGAANLYRGGGLTDWSLPSRATAESLMLRSSTLLSSAYDFTADNCSSDCLWTSWQFNGENASDVTVGGYSNGIKSKSSSYYVRPVRAIAWGAKTISLDEPIQTSAEPDAWSTTKISISFGVANYATSTTLNVYTSATGGVPVSYYDVHSADLITGLLPDSVYYVTWTSIGSDYFANSAESPRVRVITSHQETITPTVSAPSMLLGAAAPTISYLVSNPDALDPEGAPECGLFAASDTIFDNQLPLDSTTPAGDYLVNCNYAYPAYGFAFVYAPAARFSVIDPNTAGSTPTPTSTPIATSEPAPTATPTSQPTVTPAPSSSPQPQSSITSSRRFSNFSPGSATLTSALKRAIKAFVAGNPKSTSISCLGITSGPTVLKSDDALSQRRAKAACAYVKKLNPKIKTVSIKGSNSQILGWSGRRVRLSLTTRLNEVVSN